MQLPLSFFSICLVSVHVVHPFEQNHIIETCIITLSSIGKCLILKIWRICHTLDIEHFSFVKKKKSGKYTIFECVAERTSYFCLARKIIWPLWSSDIFTQWGWLIQFSPDHFLGQHKNGESPPNYLSLSTFRTWRTYFLSAPFIADAQHHEESHLIYGPLDQGFLVEHELDACNPPHIGTPLRRL